nr:HlyD family secretion protein [Variovorax dokdonensis]
MAQTDDGAARQIVAEQLANRWNAEQSARVVELQRLHLTAQQDGVLRDLDPSLAQGSWVNTTTPIGWLVDKDRWRAEVLVSEQDAQRLSAGSEARLFVQGRGSARLQGRILTVDSKPVQKLPHMLLAQNHGGPIALNASTPATALRPNESLYRVLIEGEGTLDMPQAVRLVHAQFEGSSTSLLKQWFAAAISAIIQQADF